VDFVTTLPSYLYLFPSNFSDQTQGATSHKDLESLCLAAELWELKKSGQISIQGNGTVSYLKRLTAQKPGTLFIKAIFELLGSGTTELSLLAVSLDPLELVKGDLIAAKILDLKETPKLLVFKEKKLLPDPNQVQLLSNHLSEVILEIESLKKEREFNEILMQLKSQL